MRVMGQLVLGVGLWLLASTAFAHAQYRPFSVNRYTVISFAKQQIHIDYSVTVGDLPAHKLRKRADQDQDGVLSPEEIGPLKRWMRNLVMSGIRLRLDGASPTPVLENEKVDLVSDQIDMYAPMRFSYRLNLDCPPGRHELVLHDRARLPMLEQTELFVRTRADLRLFGLYRLEDNRRLERRVFWERGELPGPVSVRFVLGDHPGTSADGSPLAGASKLLDDSGPLKRALADRRLGFWGMIAALGLSLLLGALHALSPGHGKALVASYLVGARGKVRHAVILAGMVTFTHIFSVVILGLVALWATEKVLPERLAPWLGMAAGLIVLALGIWMLVARLRRRPAHHHHPHPHQQVRWAELLVLGVSGGMVPCLSATVVLLFAVYLGRIVFGLFLIAAFSLGLALTLMILGILVVRGRRLLERFETGRAGRLIRLMPLASAVAVTVLGAVMLGLAIDGL